MRAVIFGGVLLSCASVMGQCTPEIVAQIGTGAQDLEIDDRGYLFLLAPRLGVVDIREPTSPVLVRPDEPYLGGPYFSLGLNGDTLIALHGDDVQWGHISVFDVSTPLEATRIWGPALTGDSYASASGDRFFQLSYGGPLLQVWDFSTPTPTSRAVGISLPGEGRAISSLGTTAFASTDAGVIVVDAQDPHAPEVRSVIPIAGEASRTASNGSVLLVGTETGPTYTVDVRDPGAPEILGEVERAAYAIAAAPGVAIVIEGESLEVIDMSDPSSPRVVGSLPMDGLRPRFVEVLDGFAYVASSSAVYVVDISGCLPCLADIDGSGALDLFDFLEFQRLFGAGDVRADFDRDGVLTVFDFLALQNAFAAGC